MSELIYMYERIDFFLKVLRWSILRFKNISPHRNNLGRYILSFAWPSKSYRTFARDKCGCRLTCAHAWCEHLQRETLSIGSNTTSWLKNHHRCNTDMLIKWRFNNKLNVRNNIWKNKICLHLDLECHWL